MRNLPPCAGTATTRGSASASAPTRAPISPPPMPQIPLASSQGLSARWGLSVFRRGPRRPRQLASVPVLFALCLTGCAVSTPPPARLPIPAQLRQCAPAPAIPPEGALRTDREFAELMLQGWLAGADCRAKLARVDELLTQQDARQAETSRGP